jgi:baseplate J-like protein
VPLERMNLDDLDYDDLVAQAMASIPTLYPGWTNQNASDPGITLVELFAWLVDMVIYRTNRVPPKNYQVFLGLLNGPTWRAGADRALPEAIRGTMVQLRKLFRAVTTADYEALTTGTFPTTKEAIALAEPIRRVLCLGERDVTGASPTDDAPGHVSVVVASEQAAALDSPWNGPSTTLESALASFFEARRMITTAVHVAGPGWVALTVQATIYLDDDASPEDVLSKATRALVASFHPWTGGRDRAGWPFGQWVYASEISLVLSAVPGVDCVEDVILASGTRGRTDSGATSPEAIVAIELDPHELPKIADADVRLTLMVLRGAPGQSGTSWAEWKPEES